jgi:hypothetical protein
MMHYEKLIVVEIKVKSQTSLEEFSIANLQEAITAVCVANEWVGSVDDVTEKLYPSYLQPSIGRSSALEFETLGTLRARIEVLEVAVTGMLDRESERTDWDVRCPQCG